MKDFDFSKIIAGWQDSYYTAPLMYLLSIAVFIYAIITKSKNGIVMVIICFSGTSLIQSIISELIFLHKHAKALQYINSFAISVFIVVEITCCYWLVVRSKVSRLQKRIMQLLLASFYIFEVIYIPSVFFKPHFTSFESFFELPLIIAFTTIYYYNLLTKTPQKELAYQPLFWAISGMALTAVVQIPCNIILNSIPKYTESYGARLLITITALSYSSLFVCFLKALHLHKKMQHVQKK